MVRRRASGAQTVRLTVAIGESLTKVGDLVYEAQGDRQHSVFSYDPEWLRHESAFPLSPHLPLSNSPEFSSGSLTSSPLSGPIQDSAPDSWGRAVIDAAKGADNELDYLLAVSDGLRLGALRYVDGNGCPLSPDSPNGVPRLRNLRDLAAATRSFENEPDSFARLRADFLSAAGSLGGARPKLVVMDDNGILWVAKLPSERDTRDVASAEVMALELARLGGLNAAKAKLHRGREKHPVALIQRFDRNGNRRVPYISARTLLGMEGTEPGDYASIAEMMRQHSANPSADMAELHSRLLFTVLVRNTDDHLLNHGFLHVRKGKWMMSPAFDINPQPRRAHSSLKTAISEEHGNEPSIENAISAAPFFGMTEGEAAVRAKNLAQTISTEWRKVGRHLGMSSRELDVYSPAFAHDQMKFALAF